MRRLPRAGVTHVPGATVPGKGRDGKGVREWDGWRYRDSQGWHYRC